MKKILLVDTQFVPRNTGILMWRLIPESKKYAEYVVHAKFERGYTDIPAEPVVLIDFRDEKFYAFAEKDLRGAVAKARRFTERRYHD